jgi:hypothetical protein
MMLARIVVKLPADMKPPIPKKRYYLLSELSLGMRGAVKKEYLAQNSMGHLFLLKTAPLARHPGGYGYASLVFVTVQADGYDVYCQGFVSSLRRVNSLALKFLYRPLLIFEEITEREIHEIEFQFAP